MKFSMTGQEKGDLFIHVTAYYRQPHGQVLLYIFIHIYIFIYP
jgi:hypothetical protein